MQGATSQGLCTAQQNQILKPRTGRRRFSNCYFGALSLTARPPVRPSTWYPIWIFLIFAISAGVAVLGSTLALEQVKPLNVHSDVVCRNPLCCITLLISFTTSSCMIT